MNIGLSKEEMEKMLDGIGLTNEASSIPASLVREAIITLIEANNKKVENDVTEIVSSDLLKNFLG